MQFRLLQQPYHIPYNEWGEGYVRAVWFETISSGTSGTITPPTGATFVMDQWESGVDALASTLTSGFPTYISPVTAGGTIVTATLDTAGAYTLSGTPSAYPVAVIYVYRCMFKDFDDSKSLAGTVLEGSLDDIHDGDTYGRVKLAELTAGQVNRVSDGTYTSVAADIYDAVTKKHTQNTDIILDEGGANEIAVTELIRKATADITYYVATNGNDTTGDGTTETPFATGQHAVDLLPKVLNGYNIAILFKDGTYTEQISIANFIDGEITVCSDSGNVDSVLIRAPVANNYGILTQDNGAYVYVGCLSVKIQKNAGTCIAVVSSNNVEIENVKLGDNDNTNTNGIYVFGSIVSVNNVSDIDADKVAVGLNAGYGGIIVKRSAIALGDAYASVISGGLITDGIVLNKADYDDAVTKKHADTDAIKWAIVFGG